MTYNYNIVDLWNGNRDSLDEKNLEIFYWWNVGIIYQLRFEGYSIETAHRPEPNTATSKDWLIDLIDLCVICLPSTCSHWELHCLRPATLCVQAWHVGAVCLSNGCWLSKNRVMILISFIKGFHVMDPLEGSGWIFFPPVEMVVEFELDQNRISCWRFNILPHSKLAVVKFPSISRIFPGNQEDIEKHSCANTR